MDKYRSFYQTNKPSQPIARSIEEDMRETLNGNRYKLPSEEIYLSTTFIPETNEYMISRGVLGMSDGLLVFVSDHCANEYFNEQSDILDPDSPQVKAAKKALREIR